MAFQHFLVILINNFVGQTTDKFTNLISIFKTQKKSSVMYLNILKSTAPGLTDFPLLLNHDLVYVSLFYSPLFCSINFLAIVSIPTLKRYFKHHGTMQFCKPMIVAKSTTQKSEFLVPSQFHPQHFPVELPFQLKRISLLIYFMAIYRCPTFSVIRSNNWPCQKIHILPTYYISTYINVVPTFLQICLPFLSQRTDNNLFPFHQNSIHSIFKYSW